MQQASKQPPEIDSSIKKEKKSKQARPKAQAKLIKS